MKPSTDNTGPAPAAPAPGARQAIEETTQEDAEQSAAGFAGVQPDALGLVRLEDICEPYLGMKFIVARRHQAAGTLPITAFRLASSRRGPLFVHSDDLARLIEKRRKRAARMSNVPTDGGL